MINLKIDPAAFLAGLKAANKIARRMDRRRKRKPKK
jgi:hypothetical protein